MVRSELITSSSRAFFSPVPGLFLNRGEVAPRDVVSGCYGVILEVLPSLNDPMVYDCTVLLTCGVTWENPGKDTSYQEHGFGSHLCRSGFDNSRSHPRVEAEGAWGCDTAAVHGHQVLSEAAV